MPLRPPLLLWQSKTALVLLAMLGLAAGCSQPLEPPEVELAARDPRQTPVILISLDTFRWDLLGLNSARPQSLTPNLDQFGREAARFDSMYVQVPHTLTSHTSILTGLSPGVHGVVSNTTILPTSVPSIAEILGQAGYRTAGIVSSTWLKEKFGLSRGFETYRVISNIENYTFARAINEWIVERLDDQAQSLSEQPLFLFLHYYDAHSDIGQDLPYWAPPEYLADGQLSQGNFCDHENNCATEYLIAADREEREVSRQQIDAIYSLYEAGVAYLDEEIGRLFGILKERGLYEDSLIILTADHGEEFREHGRFIHAQVYDEILRVPLMVRFPGGQHGGRVESQLVDTTDILPTILEVLDLPTAAATQGISLLTTLAGPNNRSEVFSQGKGETTLYSLRTQRYKLIYDFELRQAKLYDLDIDPKERFDLSPYRPETTQLLIGRLVAQIRENRRLAQALGTHTEAQITVEFALEETEQLKALGYLY